MSLFLMRWLVFVMMNLGAGIIATTWTVRYLRATGCPGWAGAAAAWFTLFVGNIILVQTLLGIAGWLSPLALAFVFGATAVASIIATRRDLTRANLRNLWPAGELAGLEYWRSQGLLATAFLTVWLCLALALAALLEPSTHFDTYVYHLPMVVDWMQAHALTTFYLPFADQANSYFPGNGHLLVHWLMAPLGNEVLVRLASLGMWCVLGVSLYRVCRQLGTSVRAAFAASALMLFVPVVLSEATDLAQDVTAAALFVLALSHLLEFYRRPAWSTTALLAVAAGAFAGVKYSGLTYLALLMAGWVAVLVLRRSMIGLRQILAWAVTLLLGVTALGGYWYLRNLWLTHNPMYPLRIALLGRVIFDGPILSYENRIWNHWADIRPRAAMQALVGSYNASFILVLLAALAVLLMWFVRQRKSRNLARVRGLDATPLVALITGLLAVSTVLYMQTPYSVMRFSSQMPITAVVLAGGTRFSLISLALCCVFIALALHLNPRFAIVAILFVNLSLVEGLLSGYDSARADFYGSRVFTRGRLALAAVALALGVVAVTYFQRRGRLPSLGQYRLPALASALLVVVLVGGFAVSALANYNSAWRYDILAHRFGDVVAGWRWLDEHSDHARVAYTGGVLNYPLYGKALTNHVRYVNIQGDLDERWHDFFLRGETYRSAGSRETWLENLRTWGAQYLIINLPSETVEDQWAQADPEMFKPVLVREAIHIYQIDFGS